MYMGGISTIVKGVSSVGKIASGVSSVSKAAQVASNIARTIDVANFSSAVANATKSTTTFQAASNLPGKAAYNQPSIPSTSVAQAPAQPSTAPQGPGLVDIIGQVANVALQYQAQQVQGQAQAQQAALQASLSQQSAAAGQGYLTPYEAAQASAPYVDPSGSAIPTGYYPVEPNTINIAGMQIPSWALIAGAGAILLLLVMKK